MTEDIDLLRQFADEKSEAAFTELVRRRIDFVYGVALRRVGGDAHLARDVTQGVFVALARQASRLARRPVLVSWLHTSTRFAAAKAVRTQARWRQHQEKAYTMERILSAGGEAEPDWMQVRPLLDDALENLGETDRAALLLRYFEGRPLALVGAALGLAENGARMRVERALEKLRRQLARRGVTSTAGALSLALSAQSAAAAPAGLAAVVAGASVAGGAASGGTPGGLASILQFMSKAKAVGGGAAIALLLGLGGYWLSTRPNPLDGKLDQAGRDAGRLQARLAGVVSRIRGLVLGTRSEAGDARSYIAVLLRPIAPEMGLTEEVGTIRDRLWALRKTARIFRDETGRKPANLPELIRRYWGANASVVSIDGEDYAGLDLSALDAAISLTTAGGLVVTMEPDGAPEATNPVEEARRRAQEAFRAANGRPGLGRELADYFDHPLFRADFVDQLKLQAIEAELGAGFWAKVDAAEGAFARRHQETLPNDNFAAKKELAPFIPDARDRQRFLEVWESIDQRVGS